MGYSPKLGRFLSADTIVPGAANPQAYNRYSYVLGNPLKYIDPTGHYCVGDDEDCADEGGYGPAPSSSGGGNNGGGGGGGGNDDDCDVGHCYETDNVVCPAVFECTAEEMQEYATMFQYPGQWPWNPVQDGYTYYVFPAPQLAALLGNPMLILLGAITVDISDDGLTLINQSQPTHIFHDGKVERDYSQNADGSWAVTSTGTGTNDTPIVGSFIDQANEAVGPTTFNFVDTMMLMYITIDQSLGLP